MLLPVLPSLLPTASTTASLAARSTSTLSFPPTTSPTPLSPVPSLVARVQLAASTLQLPGLDLIVDLTAPGVSASLPHTVTNQHPMVTCSQMGSLKPKQLGAVVSSHDDVPSCFTQANKYPHWRQAMLNENDALMRNQTWVLVPASQATNLIGCKWFFRVKRNPDGSVSVYKHYKIQRN